MKKLLMSFLLLPFLGMAQGTGFVINGAITGVPDKSLVYLTDANNPTDTITTAVVTKNVFALKGHLAEPGLVNLNFAGVQKKALLFLDNSMVTVRGDAADIQKIQVSGSPAHKDFGEFQDSFNPLFNKLNQLGEQGKTTGMTENLSAQLTKLTREIQDQVDKFLTEKKGSSVTPFLVVVTSQLSDDFQLLETRYNGLTENVKKSFYGKYVKEILDAKKIGSVGSDAMEFTQNDPEGKPVSLSSFRGKYVLIDFWASWCGPCRQENPNLVNAYNKYKNRNFTVLGISLDRSREPWLKAIKDDNLAWTHISDLNYFNNAVAQLYKVGSIPQNYLVDPKGKIIARDLRGMALAQRLDELLK